jgi:Arc/MetJ-type ribon-helix-helix transcriptional regulator
LKEKQKEKIIALRLPQHLEKNLSLYCEAKGVKNKSDLLRAALSCYIEPDVKDETLRLIGIKDMQEKLRKISDEMQIMFDFLVSAHKNTLAYHPEIPESLKAEASVSANRRFDVFFNSFQRALKDGQPSMFERILHRYFSEGANG